MSDEMREALDSIERLVDQLLGDPTDPDEDQARDDYLQTIIAQARSLQLTDASLAALAEYLSYAALNVRLEPADPNREIDEVYDEITRTVLEDGSPTPLQESVVSSHYFALVAAIIKGEVRRAPSRADRLIRTLPLLVQAPLPERPRDYLNRVGALYLAGFPIEAIVMGRAVVEAAITEKLPDSQVRVLIKKRPDDPIDLPQRIQAARIAGLLSPSGEQSATAIRTAANRILHEKPKFPQQVHSGFSAIVHVRTVLTDLYAADRPGT